MVMAKGIIANAADAATAVAKTALGVAATAAATVVMENVARSLSKKSGRTIPPPTSDNPMPVVEEAVRQLLDTRPVDRKRPRRVAAQKKKLKKNPQKSAKRSPLTKARKHKVMRGVTKPSRKKR
jgi:hypothetical protein